MYMYLIIPSEQPATTHTSLHSEGDSAEENLLFKEKESSDITLHSGGGGGQCNFLLCGLNGRLCRLYSHCSEPQISCVCNR